MIIPEYYTSEFLELVTLYYLQVQRFIWNHEPKQVPRIFLSKMLIQTLAMFHKIYEKLSQKVEKIEHNLQKQKVN